jgi:hypothetical protein
VTATVRLPEVTLCAVACVNVAATVRALARCLDRASFGRALLFTDAPPAVLPRGLEHIAIAPLQSSREYSRFVLNDLGPWIDTSHCLIVQWDGFVLDADAWEHGFLDYDYIGAPWPQFTDGHDVGNGGFSLRSKHLIEACRDPRFVDSGQPEDVVIARVNRSWLEQECALRFADRATASRFSFERDRGAARTFGFHGVFNLPDAIGIDGFWEIYSELDDTGTVRTDFWPLLTQVIKGPHGLRRALRQILDRMRAKIAAPPTPFPEQP